LKYLKKITINIKLGSVTRKQCLGTMYELYFLYVHVHVYAGFESHSYLIKSPKQRLETYCFCSVSSYYCSCSCSCSCYSPFFPCTMNLSTADLRNYRTEFHETWWSYRYMFLVDPKVFRFVVKGVKAIFFLGVQRGWGLL
jgi:hypothetical protein